MLRRKFFGTVKKQAQRNVSANALCLHYCDARKSHLASIKCRKPLRRPGRRPGPRWESLQRSPDPLADGEGAIAAHPKEPHPRSRPFTRLRLSPPQFFGQCKKHAQRNANTDALYVCTIVMPGKAIWRL